METTTNVQAGLMGSLKDLATELERQSNAKRDFIADTRVLTATRDNGDFRLEMQPEQESAPPEVFPMRQTFHEQLAEKFGMPTKYYNKIRENHPALLEQDINWYFQNDAHPRMIRTLDGEARAFLSNRYRPLDNFDLAQAVLPVLREYTDSGLTVRDCGLTERKMDGMTNAYLSSIPCKNQ